jgi:hypothetical protein
MPDQPLFDPIWISFDMKLQCQSVVIYGKSLITANACPSQCLYAKWKIKLISMPVKHVDTS